MKITYTPGPWKVGQDKTAIEASGAIIARTFNWANQYTPIDEGHANAKLIAAAPSLLAALRQLVADADDNVKSLEVWCAAHPHLEAARAAIAEATGGAA